MPKNTRSKITKTGSKKKDKYLKLYLEYKKGSRKSYVDLVLALRKDVARPIAKSILPISRDLTFDDLLQEGYFGIVRGIEKYDPQKGSLKSYVYRWVRAFMKRSVDEKSGDVQQKCGTCEERRKIIRVYGDMCVKKGSADWDDVGKMTNFSKSRIENLKKSQIGYVFMDAPIQKLDDGGGDLLNNFIMDENAVGKGLPLEIEQNDLREKILKVVSSLSLREEKVIRLRFGIC